uniref:Uncharacterized protein n=1 Tax=Cacopsylla melanoneura TaxID=428564 RepID=A0A8D8TYM7_9HEMI
MELSRAGHATRSPYQAAMDSIRVFFQPLHALPLHVSNLLQTLHAFPLHVSTQHHSILPSTTPFHVEFSLLNLLIFQVSSSLLQPPYKFVHPSVLRHRRQVGSGGVSH